MNVNHRRIRTSLVFGFANLAVASLLVTRALAQEPARQHLEHPARASGKSAGMCLVEPVDPPPCATPTSGTRVAP
jgi:hypothetical protein